MTARILIRQVLRLCGAIGTGDTADGDSKEDDLFEALNSLLASLSVKKLLAHESVSNTHTLVAGTATYTIGSGGTIDTARPQRIVSAFMRDSNDYDYPVKIISREEFNEITNKTTQGRPFELYYDPEYTLGKINLYFTPDDTETLHFDSWNPLAQISAVTDSIALPLEYERYLKYQLAIDVAPEFGKKLRDDVFIAARDAMKDIKTLNIQPTPMMKIDNALIGGGGDYNINNG